MQNLSKEVLLLIILILNFFPWRNEPCLFNSPQNIFPTTRSTRQIQNDLFENGTQ